MPLTVLLLKESGFQVKDVSWTISVANRKIARRTGDEDDVVETGGVVIDNHDVCTLHGYCKHFATEKDSIVFGRARFIKPTDAHPEIRLRFTPAQGLIYGPKTEPADESDGSGAEQQDEGDEGNVRKPDRPYQIPDGQGVYDPDIRDPDKGGIWAGYSDVSDNPEPSDRDDDKTRAWKARRNAIWSNENKKNGWKFQLRQ